jgi:hypothetical protein
MMPAGYRLKAREGYRKPINQRNTIMRHLVPQDPAIIFTAPYKGDIKTHDFETDKAVKYLAAKGIAHKLLNRYLPAEEDIHGGVSRVLSRAIIVDAREKDEVEDILRGLGQSDYIVLDSWRIASQVNVYDQTTSLPFAQLTKVGRLQDASAAATVYFDPKYQAYYSLEPNPRAAA